MRRFAVTVFVLCMSIVSFAQQYNMVVRKANGTTLTLNVSEVEDVSFEEIPDKEVPTSDFANGHEYVDLGLPSGILWATCNIGANSKEDIGDLFAWGETETKNEYTLQNYAHAEYKEAWNSGYTDEDGYFHEGTDYRAGYYYKYLGRYIFNTEYDAAHVLWGGKWTMPTKIDFDELKNECKWEAVTLNGVSGNKIIGPNGKSIFMANNNCWLAEGYNGESAYTKLGGVSTSNSKAFNGYGIRPVIVLNYTPYSAVQIEMVDLGLSVKWANLNVGASYPEDEGLFFAWGETAYKSYYGYGNKKEPHKKDYCLTYTVATEQLKKDGVVDANYNLTKEYDAASVILGNEWRMPTRKEWLELIKKCKWEYTIQNREQGYLITGPSGNSIFIPCVGYKEYARIFDRHLMQYWTSSTYTGGQGECYSYIGTPNSHRTEWDVYYQTFRFNGLPIRPVSEY